MLNYTTAEILYRGRTCKFLGRRIASGLWMKYDPPRFCFVCSEVWSMFEKVTNPLKGGIEYRKATKDRWDMRPYAEIYADRIVLLREVSNHRLRADFDIVSYTPTSNKNDGREWHLVNETTRTKVVGALPLEINTATGAITVTPPKQRVFDKEKRAEFNRMVKNLRREFRLRYRLGAFRAITVKDLENSMGKNASRYRIMNTPEEIHGYMVQVTSEDITSFYPLMCMVYWHTGYRFDQLNFPDAFEKLLAAKREGIYRTIGVVQYE